MSVESNDRLFLDGDSPITWRDTATEDTDTTFNVGGTEALRFNGAIQTNELILGDKPSNARGFPAIVTINFNRNVQFMNFTFGLRKYTVKMSVFEKLIKNLSEMEEDE